MADLPFVMPEWMENYRHLIRWTEGYPIERILHPTNGGGHPKWRVMAVRAQIDLLNDLKERDMLVAYFHTPYDSGGKRSFEDM